jgi:membrane associated rhomboid family serine protease
MTDSIWIIECVPLNEGGQGRQQSARRRPTPMDDRNAPPLNPLPAVVWLLALPMIVAEFAFSMGAAGGFFGPEAKGWRIAWMEQFGFFPEYWRARFAIGDLDFALISRFFAYPFLHSDITSTLFGVVILLAMGKFVGEIFRWWALLAVFFGASVVGALVYALLPGIIAPLFGAFPGVYGLIGAFTFLLWVRLVATGANQYRAFSMIGFLMLFQLLFGVLFGGSWNWVADITGFTTGFFLSFVVAPGGWARVRARIRQR